MRKFFRNIMNKAEALAVRTMNAVANLRANCKQTLANQCGEGYVDTGVKILIAVVIGALLLAGLYALFNTTIMPAVEEKIKGLFNYSGG